MLNKTRNSIAKKHTFNLMGLKINSTQTMDLFITARSPQELYLILESRINLEFDIVERDAPNETMQQIAQKHDLSHLTKSHVAVFRYLDENAILLPVDDTSMPYTLLMKFLASVCQLVSVMTAETMLLALEGLDPDEPRYTDIVNILMKEYPAELVKYSQAL